MSLTSTGPHNHIPFEFDNEHETIFLYFEAKLSERVFFSVKKLQQRTEGKVEGQLTH